MTTGPDHLEVLNTVHRWFTALDDRDWAAARAVLADSITLDLGPYGHDGVRSADYFVENNASLLEPTEFTQHHVCNEIVTVDGDEASVRYYEIAVLRHAALGDDPAVNSWTFYARGTMGLQRGAAGWQISHSMVRRTHSSGNANLRADIATL